MSAPYLITGANGYVGRALTRALLSDNHTVIATDITEPSAPQTTTITGDLAAPSTHDQLARTINTPPIIIHTAALMNTTDPSALWRANVESTRLLLELATHTNAPRVVFISTGGVYPYTPDHHHTETDPTDPIGFYGHTKRIAEQLISAYTHTTPLTAISLRLFFPFGPDQPRGTFPFIANAVRNGTPITINPNGAPRMNPVHIDDLTDLIRRAAHHPLPDDAPHEIYNAAGPETISFHQAVQRFESALDAQANIADTPGDPSVTDLLGSIDKAKRDLDWSPTRTLDTLVPSYT